MYKHKLLIHDDKFTWCMTCVSDQSGPIHSVEAEFAREGVQMHEYLNGSLLLSIIGKRYEYYDEEKDE